MFHNLFALIMKLEFLFFSAQRSGQELPHVESFYPTSCSVEGDEELVISGSNMSAQSRVVFIEKGPGMVQKHTNIAQKLEKHFWSFISLL